MRRILGELAAFAVFLFICCWALSGCKLLRSQTARTEQFECRVAALEPVVGDVLDTEQLVRDIYAGKASIAAVLGAVDASLAEVKALSLALEACNAQPDAGAPEPAGTLL